MEMKGAPGGAFFIFLEKNEKTSKKVLTKVIWYVIIVELSTTAAHTELHSSGK